MPFVNWGLFVAIVLAVVMFRSSSNLAAAYGIAVTTDMLITTVLTFFVIRYAWKLPAGAVHRRDRRRSSSSTSLFFASNLLKLFEGGWFPLLIGGVDLHADDDLEGGPAPDGRDAAAPRPSTCASFLESVFVNPPARVDGTAVFLTAEPGVVPNALLHNLKHNKVLHEQNLFVTVRNHEVPWIPMDKRIEIEPLGHHCWQVIVHYGFKNDVDLPRALEHARLRGCQLEPMTTSYFLSRDVVIPTLGSGMAPWREKLFAQMHHNASGAADFLGLPNNAVVELGSQDRDLTAVDLRPPRPGFAPPAQSPMRFFKDLSLSAFTAGFVAVLVASRVRWPSCSRPRRPSAPRRR